MGYRLLSLFRASALPLDALIRGKVRIVPSTSSVNWPERMTEVATRTYRRRPVRQPDMNPLQVRLEHPTADTGRLLADAAQVLGFSALGLVIAERRLLSTDFALASHRIVSSPSRLSRS